MPRKKYLELLDHPFPFHFLSRRPLSLYVCSLSLTLLQWLWRFSSVNFHLIAWVLTIIIAYVATSMNKVSTCIRLSTLSPRSYSHKYTHTHSLAHPTKFHCFYNVDRVSVNVCFDSHWFLLNCPSVPFTLLLPVCVYIVTCFSLSITAIEHAMTCVDSCLDSVTDRIQ